MTYVIIGVLAIVVIAAVVAFAARGRKPTDDIASFRRQIDALSPEARRPTIGRMKPPEDASTDDDGADDT